MNKFRLIEAVSPQTIPYNNKAIKAFKATMFKSISMTTHDEEYELRSRELDYYEAHHDSDYDRDRDYNSPRDALPGRVYCLAIGDIAVYITKVVSATATAADAKVDAEAKVAADAELFPFEVVATSNITWFSEEADPDESTVFSSPDEAVITEWFQSIRVTGSRSYQIGTRLFLDGVFGDEYPIEYDVILY